jgi:hypothetical protein
LCRSVAWSRGPAAESRKSMPNTFIQSGT